MTVKFFKKWKQRALAAEQKVRTLETDLFMTQRKLSVARDNQRTRIAEWVDDEIERMTWLRIYPELWEHGELATAAEAYIKLSQVNPHEMTKRVIEFLSTEFWWDKNKVSFMPPFEASFKRDENLLKAAALLHVELERLAQQR